MSEDGKETPFGRELKRFEQRFDHSEVRNPDDYDPAFGPAALIKRMLEASSNPEIQKLLHTDSDYCEIVYHPKGEEPFRLIAVNGRPIFIHICMRDVDGVNAGPPNPDVDWRYNKPILTAMASGFDGERDCKEVAESSMQATSSLLPYHIEALATKAVLSMDKNAMCELMAIRDMSNSALEAVTHGISRLLAGKEGRLDFGAEDDGSQID